ncbi:ethionine resistance protein [Coemansia sp. RSA 988]|nr:ethionine resistance protein [Coemansia sp. RSA 988]
MPERSRIPRSINAQRQSTHVPRTPRGDGAADTSWSRYPASPSPMPLLSPMPDSAHLQPTALLATQYRPLTPRGAQSQIPLTPAPLPFTRTATTPAPRHQPNVTPPSARAPPLGYNAGALTQPLRPTSLDAQGTVPAYNPHNMSGVRVADSYFLPMVPAEAAMGMAPAPSLGAQTPPQPQSMTRRQSIALQSSCSPHKMSLALPCGMQSTAPSISPARMKKQRMLPPLTISTTEPWRLVNTKSLPNGSLTSRRQPNSAGIPRPLSLSLAVPETPFDPSDASTLEQSRRRSVAHERYPPLTSIFESRDASDISCARQMEEHLLREQARAHVPQMPFLSNGPASAAVNGPSSTYGSLSTTMPRDPQAPYRVMSESIDARSVPSPQPCSSDRRSAKSYEGHSSHLTASASPIVHQEAQNDHAEALSSAKRRSSCESLASNLSSTPSLISTSSAQSSYAYIFDSARPPSSGASDRFKRYDPHRGGIEGAAFGIPHSIIRRPAGDLLLCDNGSLLLSGGIICSSQLMVRSELAEPVFTESSPLIGAESSSAATLDNESHGRYMYDAACERQPTPVVFARELRCIASTSSHLLVGSILQAIISTSQVASSGHLGRSELAAIGLAHMVVVLTGYPMIFGVLSCLQTFASQAFTSSQPQLVGAYFVRSVQILWMFGLVMGSLWFTSGPLLASILHDANPATISAAVTYLRWYFVPFMIFSKGLLAKQILCAQGITYPFPYLTLLGTAVTLSAQYLLTFAPYFRLGIRGIALGSGASYLSMLLATLWLIRRHNSARIWGGFGVRAPWRPFINLLPSCLLLALFSTGSGELITMAATQLGTGALAVQSVLSALSRMFMITFSSISIAALNRLGNLIGQRAVRGAKISACASLCIGFACVAAGGSAVVWSPEVWAGIFTSDEHILQEIVELVPIVVVAFAAQALALVCSQLLSAQGRQSLAARIKFVTLYAIGVPLGYYWAVVGDYGLAGLWCAVAVGQVSTAVIEIIVVLSTNWPRLVDRCFESVVHGM